MGTPIYVPFEVRTKSASPVYNEKTEVYAMGTMIYQIFTKDTLYDILRYENVP